MIVFISHASEQQAEAEEIALALREEGHEVFFDRSALPEGDGYNEVKTEGEKLSDAESALVTSVDHATNGIGAVLDPAAGEPYTLDELSRLVYDPFPAPMLVTVSGEITEREGFPGELKSALRIPTFSIWSAFARLEGRWFSPDPALALWRDDIAKSGKPFDLHPFLAIPRRAGLAWLV